jgi:hypothetical protein
VSFIFGLSKYVLLGEAGSNGTSGVELEGLSFIGATDVSVGALGSSNASATFDDCEWAGPSVGTTSVVIYNGAEALTWKVICCHLKKGHVSRIFQLGA